MMAIPVTAAIMTNHQSGLLSAVYNQTGIWVAKIQAPTLKPMLCFGGGLFWYSK
jgi:hypothetical protein